MATPSENLLKPSLRRRPAQLLAVLLGCLAFPGIVLCGRLARETVRDRPSYQWDFADIDCLPPPGLGAREFLDEVQYLAGLPGRLPIVDGEWAATLASAFARHPWVESVERIERTRRGYRVVARYRTPVLSVQAAGELVPMRVVDADGILLPASAPGGGLPRFVAPLPIVVAGTPWPDEKVQAAARLAGFLRPHQSRLRVRSLREDLNGFVLATDDDPFIPWGSAPGSERQGERSALSRLRRLLRETPAEESADRIELARWDARP